MLFGKNKRKIEISLGKTPKNKSNTPGDDNILHPDSAKLVEETSKRILKYVVTATVAAYATMKLADTLSQIAVKRTKSADNE